MYVELHWGPGEFLVWRLGGFYITVGGKRIVRDDESVKVGSVWRTVTVLDASVCQT